MYASPLGGATLTILRMRAPIIPACSATPTPAIATNVTATTPNAAKLATKVENTNRRPSTDRRLRISKVCSWIVYSGISTIWFVTVS